MLFAPFLLFAARPFFLFRLSSDEFFIAPVLVMNRHFQFLILTPFSSVRRNRHLCRPPRLMSWMLESSCLHKLPSGYVVHSQGRGIDGDLSDVFLFTLDVGLQAKLFGSLFYRVHQLSD